MLPVKWIILVMLLSGSFQSILCIFSLNLTAEQSSICPEAAFTCTAVDLPSAVLQWYLNEDEFAIYGVDETHQYPLTVEPQNATYSSLVGGVDIQMLSASPNRDNQDIASFTSKMTVNISALRKAGTSTVSCGSLGRRRTVNVIFDSNRVPQAPAGISVEPQYTSSKLFQIIVTWNETVSSDEYCFYIVNYTVVLIDSVHGEIVMEIHVGNDSCQDGICSTFLNLSSSNQNYEVGITATNIIGSSNLSLFKNVIYGSNANLFSHSLVFESCVTTASCFTALNDSGNCTLEYGQDATYQDLGETISAPLNSSFPLPLMEFSTLYYIQITFTLNSEHIILRRNYTTGISNGSSSFSSLQVFLTVIGLLLLVSTVALVTTWIIAHKCFNLKAPTVTRMRLCVMILAVLLTCLLTVIVWIVAFTGSLASNSCNQSSGDGVIVFAFVVSTVACMVLIVMMASCYYRKRDEKNQVYEYGIPNTTERDDSPHDHKQHFPHPDYENEIQHFPHPDYENEVQHFSHPDYENEIQHFPHPDYENEMQHFSNPENETHLSHPDYENEKQHFPHPDYENAVTETNSTPCNGRKSFYHGLAQNDEQHSPPHDYIFGMTAAKKDDKPRCIYEDDSSNMQQSAPHNIYEFGIINANEGDGSQRQHSPPHDYEYGNIFATGEDVPPFHDYEHIL